MTSLKSNFATNFLKAIKQGWMNLNFEANSKQKKLTSLILMHFKIMHEHKNNKLHLNQNKIVLQIISY